MVEHQLGMSFIPCSMCIFGQLLPLDLKLAAPVIGNPALTGDDAKVQ